MARELRDNEVRINKSGISIARNLYEQATNGKKFMSYANIRYSYDGKDIILIINDDDRSKHSIRRGSSMNYVVVDAKMDERRVGTYVGRVSGSRILCERV